LLRGAGRGCCGGAGCGVTGAREAARREELPPPPLVPPEVAETPLSPRDAPVDTPLRMRLDGDAAAAT